MRVEISLYIKASSHQGSLINQRAHVCASVFFYSVLIKRADTALLVLASEMKSEEKKGNKEPKPGRSSGEANNLFLVSGSEVFLRSFDVWLDGSGTWSPVTWQDGTVLVGPLETFD